MAEVIPTPRGSRRADRPLCWGICQSDGADRNSACWKFSARQGKCSLCPWGLPFNGRRALATVIGETGPFPKTATLLQGSEWLDGAWRETSHPPCPCRTHPLRPQPGLSYSQLRVPKPHSWRGPSWALESWDWKGTGPFFSPHIPSKDKPPCTAEPLFSFVPSSSTLSSSLSVLLEPLAAGSPPGCVFAFTSSDLPEQAPSGSGFPMELRVC